MEESEKVKCEAAAAVASDTASGIVDARSTAKCNSKGKAAAKANTKSKRKGTAQGKAALFPSGNAESTGKCYAIGKAAGGHTNDSAKGTAKGNAAKCAAKGKVLRNAGVDANAAMRTAIRRTLGKAIATCARDRLALQELPSEIITHDTLEQSSFVVDAATASLTRQQPMGKPSMLYDLACFLRNDS